MKSESRQLDAELAGLRCVVSQKEAMHAANCRTPHVMRGTFTLHRRSGAVRAWTPCASSARCPMEMLGPQRTITQVRVGSGVPSTNVLRPSRRWSCYGTSFDRMQSIKSPQAYLRQYPYVNPALVAKNQDSTWGPTAFTPENPCRYLSNSRQRGECGRQLFKASAAQKDWRELRYIDHGG